MENSTAKIAIARMKLAMGPAAPRTFRSAIELVALQVSVVDADGKYVAGLGEGDFGVYQDGAPQSIALFASARAPIDVMLLLDTSSSMTGRLDLAQNAAISFLRVLRPEDRAAIVLFRPAIAVVNLSKFDSKSALKCAVCGCSPGSVASLSTFSPCGPKRLAKSVARFFGCE